MVGDDLIRGLSLGNQGTDNFIFKTQFMSGETDAGTGVRKRFPIFAVSGFGIVVIFVGNRAMVYKLCAAIADIRGPVQTVTAFFFKIRACLVAGGAGSTFHATENNFYTGIFLFAMVSMNTEVMGIIKVPLCHQSESRRDLTSLEMVVGSLHRKRAISLKEEPFDNSF